MIPIVTIISKHKNLFNAQTRTHAFLKKCCVFCIEKVQILKKKIKKKSPPLLTDLALQNAVVTHFCQADIKPKLKFTVAQKSKPNQFKQKSIQLYALTEFKYLLRKKALLVKYFSFSCTPLQHLTKIKQKEKNSLRNEFHWAGALISFIQIVCLYIWPK